MAIVLFVGEVAPQRDVLVEIDSMPVAVVLALDCTGGELDFPGADGLSFGIIIPGLNMIVAPPQKMPKSNIQRRL